MRTHLIRLCDRLTRTTAFPCSPIPVQSIDPCPLKCGQKFSHIDCALRSCRVLSSTTSPSNCVAEWDKLRNETAGNSGLRIIRLNIIGYDKKKNKSTHIFYTTSHVPSKKLATTTHQRYYSRICVCSFSAGLRTLILPSRPLHMRRKARKDGSLLYPLTRPLCLCPWRESNPHLTLRTGLLYPLSYKGPVALADRATGYNISIVRRKSGKRDAYSRSRRDFLRVFRYTVIA